MIWRREKMQQLLSIGGLFTLLVAGFHPTAALASGVEVELDAEMRAIATCPTGFTCITVPGAQAEASYEKELLTDGVTLKSAELEGKVKIPIPTASLGILDSTTAASAIVTMDLTRPTTVNNVTTFTTYATCTFAFKKASGKSNGAKAQYALKLQTKLTGTTHVPGKKQVGSCTLDAIDMNIQSGDVAYISVNGNGLPGATDILTGVFGGEEEEEDD